MKRHKLFFKKFFLSLILAAIVAHTNFFAATASPSETTAIIKSELPAVEVVFVLDTTGSMSGLIAAAKEKIWSIANTLASADPAPDIRMGLVGYRDRGDDYVTKFTPLSDDLDTIYAHLMQYQAGGGGDTPESVNQALYEAVTKTDWNDRPTTYRVIFLVGDAPPHMNYQNDVAYTKSCRLATKRGIIVNTIQCGTMAATTPVWREIAQLAEGNYFQVAQGGSAVFYETPYDEEIARLSRDLDATRIYYGDPAEREKMEEREATAAAIYEGAASSAVAKRTIFNAQASGAKNFLGSQELVHDVGSGTITVADLKKDELPAELQAMNEQELKKHIAHQSATRKKLQTTIAGLAGQRQAYIEEQVKAEKGKGADSLDAKMYECIRTQAAGKNIIYKDGPEY